jgi:hypothetical protein
MRTVAILTLTFLPSTFVSVSTLKRYALSPYILAPLTAYIVLGYFQYQFLQLHSCHRARKTIVDRFRQILDLLDVCRSSYGCYNRILVCLAALVRLKVRPIWVLLLDDPVSRGIVRASQDIYPLRCHDWMIGIVELGYVGRLAFQGILSSGSLDAFCFESFT